MSVAPGIFQNLIDSLLKGIPGITPFFDSILIVAPTSSEFAGCLCTMLQWFQTTGLKVKWGKYFLGVPCLNFLGFTMDADGIHLAQDKIHAICSAPVSQNNAKLHALELLNFDHAFPSHKVAVVKLLHRLLDNQAQWI